MKNRDHEFTYVNTKMFKGVYGRGKATWTSDGHRRISITGLPRLTSMMDDLMTITKGEKFYANR